MVEQEPGDSSGDQKLIDIMYHLEDARLLATAGGYVTLRYFLEIALMHAKKIAKGDDDGSDTKVD